MPQTIKKPQEIAEQQKSLAQSIYEEQRRRAYQTQSQGERGLSEQVRGQRFNMQQGRQQLSEQGFMAQRAINQEAAARGLGSSGIRNLSLVQSQMAQGGAANEMEQQNVQFQRAVMDAKRSLGQDFAGDMASADLNKQEGMLEAERSLLAEQHRKQDLLMGLYEMAMQGASSGDLRSAMAVMGISADDFSEEALGSVLGQAQDPYGDAGNYRRTIDWGQAFKEAGIGAGLGATVGFLPPGMLATAGIGFMAGGLKSIVNQTEEGIRISNDRGDKTYSNWDEALSEINQNYQSMPESDKIKAVRKSRRIVFEVKLPSGEVKDFKSYNEALEHYRQNTSR